MIENLKITSFLNFEFIFLTKLASKKTLVVSGQTWRVFNTNDTMYLPSMMFFDVGAIIIKPTKKHVG